MRTSLKRVVVVTTAVVVALAGIAPPSAYARPDAAVEGLTRKAKEQQDKLKTLGEKLKKAGEEFSKPPADKDKEKAYNDARAEYDKMMADHRETVKKLDDAAKGGGASADDAKKSRDEAIQGLAKLIGDLVAGILGAFFGGMTQTEQTKVLEASSKVVLGVPLTSDDIAALAKVPKDKLGQVTQGMTDFYKSFHQTPTWPALRDLLVAAATEQNKGMPLVATAIEVVGKKLKEQPNVVPAAVADAVKATLPGGKFNTDDAKKKFLETVGQIAPKSVTDELEKIEVSQ